jgi:serine/threonine protein kinase
VTADALDSQHALALRPGVLLADRFRLVRLIRGTSSFAFSYEAEDLTSGDTVIIKEFFPRSLVSRAADGAAIKPHSPECERDFLRALHRFALEGAVLAESTHPNLVRVRAVVDANGTVYLVMDRYEAQPLAEFIRGAGGRIASSEAGRLAHQLLAALQVLHSESIIHRDLSPRSVHVGADGAAILLEFSARRHLPLHASDLASGFAAFEQYGMREIGPWTDVYAVSALLYYMLTGNAPPSALERAAGEAVPSPIASVPGVIPGLARLAVKGMALLPQQRPHAVSELRRQLDGALAEANATQARNAANALAADMAADSASIAYENAGDDERAAPLRLAAGGIVVPGEERSARLLRKLGSVASRLRRTMAPNAIPDLEPDEEPESELRYSPPPPTQTVTPARQPEPVPTARQPEPAPTPLRQAPLASSSHQAEGVTNTAPPVERPKPVAPSMTFARVAVSERARPAVAAEPSREFDLATELALASDEMHAKLERDTTRRRYSLAAGTALVLVVGGALVLLARNSRASSIKPLESQSTPTAAAPSNAVALPVAADPHVTVDGGAVLQSGAHVGASAARAETDAPEPSVKRVSATTAPAQQPAAPAPARDAMLPTAKTPNVKIAVMGATSDLRLMPPELLVDSRTRLTTGQDQIEQGEYATARHTFRSAMLQLDSVAARYPESQAVKSLKHDLEQADARAVQACGAENEMRKRRGEQARACQ